jgi:hypothetical protein
MLTGIYDAPKGLPPSRQYRLFINNQEVFVYDAQVCLDIDPMRNIEKPFLSSYAYFDAEEDSVVEICVKPLFAQVAFADVLPKSRAIEPSFTEDAICFSMSAPDQIVVVVNELRDQVLMIFANPPLTDAPNPDDENVIYFGPGLHIADDPDNIIRLKSGQTLFIAGGAVVTGVIEAVDVENIRICGRGILDGSGVAGRWHEDFWGIIGRPQDAPHRRHHAEIHYCKNVEIDGVIFADPPAWTMYILHCEDVRINNIKIIGHQMNSDGIDICSTHRVRGQNIFIRTSDDNLAIKAYAHKDGGKTNNVQDVEFKRCVLWADRASALEIGHELCAEDISSIRFRDIDILDQREATLGYHAIDITNSDYADVHDILFEDIRVENCARLFGARIREGIYGNSGRAKGKIRDISLRNIHCGGRSTVTFFGRDAEHKVRDIRIENFYVNGKLQKTFENEYHNPYVENIRLFAEGAETDVLAAYPPTDKCVPLDISPMCNIIINRFYDLHSDDWFRMPDSVQILEGIPFNIAGTGYIPNGNGTHKRAVVPAKRRGLEQSFSLPVNAKSDWMFFLHTSIHVYSEIDSLLCRYLIKYADGEVFTIRVRNANDAHDWRLWSMAGWQPVIEGIRTYIMPWRNPYPQREIESITMLDGDIPELPVLLAVTRA